MTERERLIELLDIIIQPGEKTLGDIADYLIANGVIVPPCKVGQTVYTVSRYYTGTWEIYKCSIDSITKFERHTFLSMSAQGKFIFGEEISQIGKTVFFTHEEALKALKEREGI